MKKRLFAIGITVCMVFLLAFASGCGKGSEKVVNVYNWGEYIDESVLKLFEKRTGIHVNYNTFETNESMYAALKNGGSNYDVIFPSDYMISRMIAENMLQPIDYQNIPNASKINLKDFNVQSALSYDPDGAYSVPYAWGTVGIIYNTKTVKNPVTSWGGLFDASNKGQILMFNNARDGIGIALKYLGYSLNTINKEEIKKATDLLIDQKQKGLVQAYVMDQIFEKMIGGEAAIGPYYAGDALTMIQENPDLAFCYPKEGTNLFVDAMCIPKNADNKENAGAFINFMCDPEIMVMNAKATGYAVPSRAAYELLDPEEQNSKLIYPDASVLKNCEIYKNLPQDVNAFYDSEWSRLTMAKSGS
ncbi:MAG: spermidine/putrescine ABC transporter substrate-binding protein [Oscillospiraceae bacterium]|nr:spermidine/putrescine ABC transporter substrate-binding protein [Oscillospiraceae bacterium]